MPALKALDFYSGVGGWSLGLKLAGISIAKSYERWGEANQTNRANNGHSTVEADIRRLNLQSLPGGIDIVVGSPPCTEFSLSNRGGQGDLSDGLTDIAKFLRIVDHIGPRNWALENVPRIAPILAAELRRGGRLYKFRHLAPAIRVVDMAEYGLPQRRRRCIVGNFDFDLLGSYREVMPRLTLGEVLDSLSRNPVSDPNYKISLSTDEITDHILEDYLSDEEVRINRSAKMFHPIYNQMRFPDLRDRPVRTITATCTRVSRESVVIAQGEAGDFRRLSIRERASLQGFPVTFDFLAKSYARKLRMVGNAMPPPFAYLIGHAILGTKPQDVTPLNTIAIRKRIGSDASNTQPDRCGKRFPAKRRFRFTIPNLRLGSGVRFEFTNFDIDRRLDWKVAFVFGTSKSIHVSTPNASIAAAIQDRIPRAARPALRQVLMELQKLLSQIDHGKMQQAWTHTAASFPHPFGVVDAIGIAAEAASTILLDHPKLVLRLLEASLLALHGRDASNLIGLEKLRKNASVVVAGLLIGGTVNAQLAQQHASTTAQSSKRIQPASQMV